MSQKATRKPEETIKNQKPDISPIMEVKKKVTQTCQVNIERPAEKPENKAKPAEKPENKAKPAEKPENKAKPAEKPETKAKPVEKTDNKAKPVDKPAEKAKDKVGEKSGEKNAEKEEKKQNGQESEKADNSAKQNGSKANGNSTPKPVPVPTTNGNGTAIVEIDSSDDEEFPELTYDESDIEPTSSGRAVTRREQVKASRTPETPRPASVKDIDNNIITPATVVTAAPTNTETAIDKDNADDAFSPDTLARSVENVIYSSPNFYYPGWNTELTIADVAAANYYYNSLKGDRLINNSSSETTSLSSASISYESAILDRAATSAILVKASTSADASANKHLESTSFAKEHFGKTFDNTDLESDGNFKSFATTSLKSFAFASFQGFATTSFRSATELELKYGKNPESVIETEHETFETVGTSHFENVPENTISDSKASNVNSLATMTYEKSSKNNILETEGEKFKTIAASDIENVPENTNSDPNINTLLTTPFEQKNENTNLETEHEILLEKTPQHNKEASEVVDMEIDVVNFVTVESRVTEHTYVVEDIPDTEVTSDAEVTTTTELTTEVTSMTEVITTTEVDTDTDDVSTTLRSEEDPSKEKVLQLKDGVPERKLRSADSPKPEVRKVETPKKETPKKEKKEAVNGKEKEIEVVVEIENEEELSQRKTDTNFSKSRVKVSPYRRSGRLADQTTTSVQANYTGNNTTMEMDITESSFAASEQSMDDSYLSTIRNMRGRRSYKLLKDLDLTANRSLRSNASTSVAESSARPTAPVVGRKRKPEQDESVELAAEAGESPAIQTKRMRLLERIAQPFRRTQHTAEIVGVNTDLPLTAPIATPSIDPETLKSAAVAPATNPSTIAAPTAAADGKRCVIM